MIPHLEKHPLTPIYAILPSAGPQSSRESKGDAHFAPCHSTLTLTLSSKGFDVEGKRYYVSFPFFDATNTATAGDGKGSDSESETSSLWASPLLVTESDQLSFSLEEGIQLLLRTAVRK